MFPVPALIGALILTLTPQARAADRPDAPASTGRAADTCASPVARSVPEVRAPDPARPADTCRGSRPVRPRAPDAGDPFLAAMLGALPLASGFYVSDTPVKGAAFTLADVMLIGAIIQIRSDANRPPKDAATYYWLLAGVNLADAVLSALQVRSDAARRLSVNVNPSDRPGILLGWRF